MTNEISCYIEGIRWSRCRKNLVKQSWFCGFRTDGLVGVKYRQAQVPESEVVPKEAKLQETIAQWILLGLWHSKQKLKFRGRSRLATKHGHLAGQ